MEFRRFESAAPLTANGSGRQKPMNGNQNNLRNIVVWIIIGLLVLALINLLSPTSQRAPSSELSYTQLVAEATAGKIQTATFQGDKVTGKYRDGDKEYTSKAPKDTGELVETLRQKNVDVRIGDGDGDSPTLLSIL